MIYFFDFLFKIFAVCFWVIVGITFSLVSVIFLGVGWIIFGIVYLFEKVKRKIWGA